MSKQKDCASSSRTVSSFFAPKGSQEVTIGAADIVKLTADTLIIIQSCSDDERRLVKCSQQKNAVNLEEAFVKGIKGKDAKTLLKKIDKHKLSKCHQRAVKLLCT